jgi:Ca-activated chloride channel family protein
VSFDNPRALFALLLLVPTGIMSFLHYRRRRAVLRFLSPGDGLASKLRYRYFVSAVGFILFLACLIVALAQPRGGARLVSETRRGVDVIFAIDLSRSMDVRDISPGGPSRLGRAASLMMELVNNPRRASGLRFGAAIGKGKGVLALPLTEDTEAIAGFVAGLSGSVLTGRGTNLESLVDAASASFQDAFPSQRRIVLLSDGESLGGSLSNALDRAIAADVAIIAVGLGSEGGGAVPLGGDTLLGEDGRPVISRVQSEALREAAARTGGAYIDGNLGNAGVLLADRLASLGGGGNAATVKGFRRETRPLGYVFVIAALVFMGISKMAEAKLPLERGRRHGQSSAP